jgi:hypothetical protein
LGEGRSGAGASGALRDRPAAISLLRQGAIIQQADVENLLRFGFSNAPYELRQCLGVGKSALVLTHLSLLFLQRLFGRAPGFSSSEDLLMAMKLAMKRFLAQNTALIERTDWA